MRAWKEAGKEEGVKGRKGGGGKKRKKEKEGGRKMKGDVTF